MSSAIFETKLSNFNKHCDMYRLLSFTPSMKYIYILILIYKSQSFVFLSYQVRKRSLQ